MTLFEAIRQIKPGQEIQVPFREGASIKITWKHGEASPSTEIEHGERPLDWAPPWDLSFGVLIIDLPAPKLTLEEAAKEIVEGMRTMDMCNNCAFTNLSCKGHSCIEGRILYALQAAAKMNIDWEAK